MSTNLVRHPSSVTPGARRAALGQAGGVVWLTGLSGSGKSTVACAAEAALVDRGRAAFVLDGDNLRHGLCKDLGFSPEDRAENIRRVGEVAALMAQAGVLVLCAFVSPYRAGRAGAREACRAAGVEFLEVHVATALETCEGRDPKGLYARARAGEIPQFTGISAPYEAPEGDALRLETAGRAPADCAAEVLAAATERGMVPAP